MNYHYYPILKWKRAEQKALSALPEDVKAKICPIIEVRKNRDSVDELYESVGHYWGVRDFIIDFATSDGLLDSSKLERADALIDKTQNSQAKTVLCFWHLMLKAKHVAERVRRAQDSMGAVCIRIRGPISEVIEELPKCIDSLKVNEIKLEKTVLLIDTKNDKPPKELVTELSKVLTELKVNEFSEVIFGNGSFPKTRDIDFQKEYVSRKDIVTYLELSDQLVNNLFEVKFSDYTCHDPSWEDKELTSGPAPIVLRVADNTQWIVTKVRVGNDVRPLIQIILNDHEFVRCCKCPGCVNMKDKVATTNPRPGNYETHLANGIIHHIIVTIKLNLEAIH